MGDGEDCAVSQTGLDHLQEQSCLKLLQFKNQHRRKLSDIMLVDMDSIAFRVKVHVGLTVHILIFLKKCLYIDN